MTRSPPDVERPGGATGNETDRAGQAQQLAHIFDQLAAVVYVADLQTYQLLYVNRHARSLFGDDVLGKPCYQVLQAGKTAPCEFCTNHLLAHDGRPAGAQVWEFQNTLTQRWYLCVDQAVHWKRDTLARLEVAVDITDQKKAEQFRDQYVSLISHDLKGALNTVSLGCEHFELLAADRAAETEAKVLSRVQSAARHMRKILDSLSDAGHVAWGQRQLDLVPLDVAPIVAAVARTLTTSQHPISYELPKGPLRVLGERAAIERILDNLIGNAIKYSPEGSVVQVRAVANDESVVIAVEDAGPGIEPWELSKIFERFYRTDSAKQTSGLGLGLYLTRLLVQAQGGNISVESELGHGTRFRFSLPKPTAAG